MKSYLTYCEDHKDIASEIERRLSGAGAEFTHDTRDEEEQNRMKREMRLTQDPVFLLVGDDFLKSQQCMRGALAFITDMGITRNIRPVITNGKVNQPDTYVEYWQNKYQELRSQKHEIPQHEQEAYNWEVMIIRRISNEVAPFIDEVNKRNPVTYEEFQADNFRTFYIVHGREPDEPQGLTTENDDSPTNEIIVEQEEQKSSLIPPVIPAVLPFSKTKDETTGIAEDGLETELEQADDLIEDLVNDEVIVEDKPELDLFDESVDDSIGEEVVTEDELKALPDEISETPVEDIFEEEITTEDELKSFDGEVDEMPAEDIFEEKIIENTPANESETTTFAHQNNTPEIEENDLEEEEITWAEAHTAEAAGNYDVARMHYETLLEKTPYHADGHYRYGLLLLNQFNEKDAAIEQFEVAVEQKNKFTEAWLELAHLAEKEEDYLLTKSYYEKIVSYEDDNAEAHYRLGNVVARYFDDQPQQAAEHYQKAIELDPDHNDARYEYATLLSAHFAADEEAREQLEAVIANDPEHPFAYYDLAVLNRKAGRKTRAYKQYKRATEINSMFKTDKNDQLFKKPKKKKKKDCSKKANPENYQKLIEEHEVAPISGVQAAQAEPKSTPQYTVLITGGTSGTGKATAELFARNGHRVIVTGRRGDRLQNLKEDFENQYNTDVKTLLFDVRDHNAVTTATKQLTDEWQHIDILINNAGLALGRSSIHEGNLEDWDTMIDTNVKGLLYMTRAIAPRMAERGKGHIVNISSISGKEVYPGGAVYCATKHAVDAITRGARMDLVKHGIRVSSISPGHVLTEFADVRYKGDQDRVEEGYAGFDPLKADDIADVVYYVATRPESVNIQDVYMFSKQQASAMVVDRSGKA